MKFWRESNAKCANQKSPPPLRRLTPPQPLPQGEGLFYSPPPVRRGIKGVGCPSLRDSAIDSANLYQNRRICEILSLRDFATAKSWQSINLRYLGDSKAIFC
ncbi:hypothetical protein ACWIUD_02505 [Helicobacter sp. 23-1044]